MPAAIIVEGFYPFTPHFLRMGNNFVDFGNLVVDYYHIFFNIIIRLYTTGTRIAGKKFAVFTLVIPIMLVPISNTMQYHTIQISPSSGVWLSIGSSRDAASEIPP